MPIKRRVKIEVRGAVQGVGFRPYVYGLAQRLDLAGFVLNEPEGVQLELEGENAAIEAFLTELRTSPPPLARIQEVQVEESEPRGESGFLIRESAQAGSRSVLIMPDLATCPDCLRELADPVDRRYRYPFINCTNCGPRYTIIQDLPYDRAKTTMAEFEMCPACLAEYRNPANRRFHAEPTCCPVCGPHVTLTDTMGTAIACDDPIAETIRRLSAGQIVAIKGLGGFHLACDAANVEAVRMLRKRKHRDLKPFAIMVADVEKLRGVCEVPIEARKIVESQERPILLLDKTPGHPLVEEVAPRSASFGVMLPYTPLHHLLMQGPYRALVMTSGNVSHEPIAHKNDEALARLAEMADCFLLHNRGIHIRTDDSVARFIAGKPRFLRRSRGYAPFPVRLPMDTAGYEVLAVGPELNNTVCLTRNGQAFLSHHIGDLQNVPAYEGFLQAVAHMQSILDVKPDAVACDLHPGYLSTRYARECGLPCVPVQHHHAHIASVLAEARRTDRVIGIAVDGMGLGTDSTPWGGEFLVCDLAGFERAGHLEPVPQPGGDVAAERLSRMAYAYLWKAFGEGADERARALLHDFPEAERKVVARMIERGLNCPLTSSLGRLFDAASALLGICTHNSHHAQAPMELEAAACEAHGEQGFYPARIEPDDSGVLLARTSDIVREMVEDFQASGNHSICAARFHNSLAQLALDICARIRNNTGLSTVALSGGVAANALWVERTVALLESDGFEVLLNVQAPPGDGGVSLGQAAIAAWRRSCV